MGSILGWETKTSHCHMAKKKRKKQKGSVTSNSTSGIEIPLKGIESVTQTDIYTRMYLLVRCKHYLQY